MRISDWSSDLCSSDLPGPIVDSHDTERLRVADRVPTDDAQQRVLADREHQSARQVGSGRSTQGDAEMPDDDFEPRRPASGPTGDLFPQQIGRATGRERECKYG